ncbi:MAG TPA: TIGR04222 domain-containing membrane protein [Polyangia bacterium]|jgi:uncharacterized protein (TIGR04222 family)
MGPASAVLAVPPNPVVPGLHSPEFLGLYVGLFVLVLVLGRIVRAGILGGAPPLGFTLDLYGAAYLRGGALAVIETVVFRLASMQMITPGAPGECAPNPAAVKDLPLLLPVEMAVYQALQQNPQLAALRVTARAAVDAACAPMRERFMELSLTPSANQRLVLGLVRWGAGLFMLGLGLTRAVGALAVGRGNIGFLLVLMLGFTLTLALTLRAPATTAAGQKLLDHVRRDATRASALAAVGGAAMVTPTALALGVAAIGLTALAGTPYAALQPTLQPVSASVSVGSSGDSGGDGGGDCGGGCGGGCGGCGGY